MSINNTDGYKYFALEPDGRYRCTICAGGRPMRDRKPHMKLRSHLDEIALREPNPSRTGIQAVPPAGLNSTLRPPALERDAADENGSIEAEHHFSTAVQEESDEDASTSANISSLFDSGSDSDHSEADRAYDAQDYLARLLAEEETDSDESDRDFDTLNAPSSARASGTTQATSSNAEDDWYPFKKKEHLVGLLLIGTHRNIMSKSQYQRVRAILQNLNVSLPDWSTLRRVRAALQQRTGMKVVERTSALQNPCFAIRPQDIISQELANPLTSPHITYVPASDVDVPVVSLSQAKKWREEMSPDARVQMLHVGSTHFYLYEPVQLADWTVVVPIFFYSHKDHLMSKCLPLRTSLGSDNQVRLSIRTEPHFHSKKLKAISVDMFKYTFPHIQLEDGSLLKDRSPPHMFQSGGADSEQMIPIPNPWRTRANGMIIRHVPLTLYSDDTSGNVSKKYNKHMSYYFTLSGLPPKLTNQEYHIHFLATSNSASALELGDQIIDDLNECSQQGFVAYDFSISKRVLVVPWVLCHIGDGPMHAEITNTTNPSSTLNPCRICELAVNTRGDKKTAKYIQDFVGIDQFGVASSLRIRDWAQTGSLTKTLWTLARERSQITRFDQLSSQYGIRDSLNLQFVRKIQDEHRKKVDHSLIVAQCQAMEASHGQHMFNPFLRLESFNGHLDTPVEILHVVLLGVVKYLYRDFIDKLPPAQHHNLRGRWQSFNTSGLNVPPIQPTTMVQFARSLVGKEFRLVVQAAPFVMFPFLDEKHRHLWSLLGHLCSYLFQTEIDNKKVYLQELKIIVSRFLSHLTSITAQWTNKPKFHMLTHLAFSIDRFGPAAFVATEKDESFNGVTRIASVHSNRHSPGHDIAETFLNGKLLRMVVSGASFYDSVLNTRARAGPKVRELFANSRDIQKAFGWNLGVDKTLSIKLKYTRQSRRAVPQKLLDLFPSVAFSQVETLELVNGQIVEDGVFVLVQKNKDTGPGSIFCFCSAWEGVKDEQRVTFIEGLRCTPKDDLHPWYAMREITKVSQTTCFQAQDIICVLNVQHNCHDGQCPVTVTRAHQLERRNTGLKRPEVSHSELNSYVVNAAALYSAAHHRDLTAHEWIAVAPEEWERSVTAGLNAWRGTV